MSLRTIEYLFGGSAGLFWPGVIAAMAVAVVAGVLSPLVVLRRLSFVGQGVSHAGFAGLGFALVLTWLTGGAVGGAGGWGLISAMVLVTSLAAGVLMARLWDRGERGDTAIGVVMVGGMALGFVLMRVSAARVTALTGQRPPELESVLFGSVVSVGWWDALGVGVVCAVSMVWAWWYRRAVLMWAVDEEGAQAFGVRTDRVRLLVMVLLSLVVVAAVRVAGVVLASAVLVLPGAAALRRSQRLSSVLMWSVGLSVGAVVVGGVMAFEFDVPPGPTVVLAGVLIWTVSMVLTPQSSAPGG